MPTVRKALTVATATAYCLLPTADLALGTARQALDVPVHGFDGDQHLLVLETVLGVPSLDRRGEPRKGVGLRFLRADELRQIRARDVKARLRLLALDFHRLVDPVQRQAREPVAEDHQHQDSGSPEEREACYVERAHSSSQLSAISFQLSARPAGSY